MVGGHAAGVSNEMVLRFEFPERPGALFNFLNKLGGRWNISMFHYRNHGAADGRVVAGLQVPHEERHLVPAALEETGYPTWDERDNPAYPLFMGSTRTRLARKTQGKIGKTPCRERVDP